MLSIVWLIFVAIMIAAVVIDLLSYRIPNQLVLALIVLFIVVATPNWSEVQWLSHIAAVIVVFGLGLVFYAFRQMGAGDVKLLSAAALWSGVSALPALAVYVSLCGVVGMLAILALRLILPRLHPSGVSERALLRVLTKGQGIPYAIGIGPGGILASFGFEPWLWLF